MTFISTHFRLYNVDAAYNRRYDGHFIGMPQSLKYQIASTVVLFWQRGNPLLRWTALFMSIIWQWSSNYLFEIFSLTRPVIEPRTSQTYYVRYWLLKYIHSWTFMRRYFVYVFLHYLSNYMRREILLNLFRLVDVQTFLFSVFTRSYQRKAQNDWSWPPVHIHTSLSIFFNNNFSIYIYQLLYTLW